MAKALKGFIIAFFTSFFTKWVEDFFIFAGIVVLVVNTYLLATLDWAIIAGNYTLAVVLLIIGIVASRS